MKQDTKLYKITLGRVDRNGDCPNWSSVNVLAVNVWEAINKVKAKKNEYTAEATIIDNVDIE